MPTYEYGCEACGHGWELEQRISEDPIKKCPKCKKAKARRLISGGNFILKGSGWYADLYHKPSSGSSKKGDDGGGEKSGGEKASSSESKADTSKSDTAKSETKSDSKPAKKSSSKDAA
jgi:putative FmdB family regulatory protein